MRYKSAYPYLNKVAKRGGAQKRKGEQMRNEDEQRNVGRFREAHQIEHGEDAQDDNGSPVNREASVNACRNTSVLVLRELGATVTVP